MATISCEIPNDRLLAGMVLISTHGGANIHSDARPSGVLVGCTRVDTELGTLYLDTDGSSHVEFNLDDYDTDPRDPLKEEWTP